MFLLLNVKCTLSNGFLTFGEFSRVARRHRPCPQRSGSISSVPVRSFVWTLAILSLAAWVGAGTFFATVVARSAFATLPSRTLAGDLNGRVLSILDLQLAVAAAVFLLAILLIRKQEEIAMSARVLLTRLPLIAITAAIVSRTIVTPRLERLREAMPMGIDAVAKTDALRVQFGRFHAMSSSLLLVSLLGGLVCASVLGAEISRRTFRGSPLATNLPPTLRITPDDDEDDENEGAPSA